VNQDEKHNGKWKKTIEKEANNIPVKEYISNPPVQQKQSQVRKQPSAIGAPTTSSYKAAGARSSRERKQSKVEGIQSSGSELMIVLHKIKDYCIKLNCCVCCCCSHQLTKTK